MDAELENLFPAEDPFAPKYPAWLYKTVTEKDPFGGERSVRTLSPPTQPEQGQFDDWISGDVLLHGELLRRFRQDLRTYRQLDVGIIEQFDPDTDAYFISSEPTIQVNKIAAMVAGTPHQVNYPWKTKTEREKSADMEAFALWFLDQWAEHHRGNNNTALKWDIAWYMLVLGRAVSTIYCDLEDGDFPWFAEVLDPATCFPVWGKGKHGMLRMSRQFTAETGEVLDEFDPTDSKGLARKLSLKQNTKNENAIDLTQEVMVTSCTTRWHRYTAVDGIEVERVAHEYGEVNYVLTLAPGEASTGSAAGTSDTRGTGLTASDIKRGFGTET